MNLSIEEGLDLVKGIHYGCPHPGEVDVVVAPIFTGIYPVAQFLKDSYIGVSGQSLHQKDSGAFTGEIPGGLLKDAGADYVIIGHSERRAYFGETNELVNQKIHGALKHQLIPILCVGETLEQREAGELQKVIATQMIEGLASISGGDMEKMVVAYEPVWAIGTGKTASPEQAQEVHLLIRTLIEKLYNGEIAQSVRILYGGSVNPKNAKTLMGQRDIDGALVGGAALKADSFISIIKAAQ